MGSGRLIFSHTWSDAEFAKVATRFVAAACVMRADGWWSGPALTNKAIRRQVTREILSAGLRRVSRRTLDASATRPSLEASW